MLGNALANSRKWKMTNSRGKIVLSRTGTADRVYWTCFLRAFEVVAMATSRTGMAVYAHWRFLAVRAVSVRGTERIAANVDDCQRYLPMGQCRPLSQLDRIARRGLLRWSSPRTILEWSLSDDLETAKTGCSGSMGCASGNVVMNERLINHCCCYTRWAAYRMTGLRGSATSTPSRNSKD